jgi:signal transduction histidine kinase
MNLLTSAMLDLSRIGSRKYNFETVDTDKIIKRCIDNLAFEITQKNVAVNCEELPAVTSDGLALEQVFANILDNAVKYLDPARPGSIAIHALHLPGIIQFSIQDNGRGIPDKDRDKVFDVFRRAGNTGVERGAGMGMAYVRALLRKLGGTIWYISQVNQGTTFFFTVPDAPPQPMMKEAA